MGRLIDLLAGLICVGAGIYLLRYNAAAIVGFKGTSWFQIIGHGMGIYFIGKGIFGARSNILAASQKEQLKYLADWAAFEHRDDLHDPHRD